MCIRDRYSVPEGKILKTKQVDHSGVQSVVKVLWKETAVPRCRATDSRWNRSVASLVSSVPNPVLIPLSSSSSSLSVDFP